MRLFVKSTLILALVVACSGFLGVQSKLNALTVTNRSLNLASVQASATTEHTIKFNFQTNNSVGSLKFEYCTSPLEQLACVAPAGIDSSTADLTAQSGETGFSIFSQTANEVILGRTAAVTGAQDNSYTLDNIQNPGDIGSFYLRIGSYASTDGTGSNLDYGGTVGSITQSVNITTEVPPILNFCVGVSIPTSCGSASGSFLNLGNLSTSATRFGTSQFMVGTNANFGYAVRANGTTLTSGNNTIAALALPTSSQIGSSQFGMNLRNNGIPNVGADPSTGSGSPTTNYNTTNSFRFNNGSVVAGNNFVSDDQRFTVSYIVNVSDAQPVGIYNTTITYVCTATF